MKLYKNLSKLYYYLQKENKNEKVIINQHIGPGIFDKVKMNKYIYRGQKDAYQKNNDKSISINDVLISETLIPSATPKIIRLFSNGNKEEYSYNYLTAELMQRIVNHTYLNNKIKELGKNIAIPILQHYGYPTSALDVTFNLRVALNFASLNGEEDKIKKDSVGVIYRFKTKEITNKTRLMIIPENLDLARPKMQEAAYLEMISLIDNKKVVYDYNLSHISDFVESFYFIHDAKDEMANWNQENAYYKMSYSEIKFINEIFMKLPDRIDITDYITETVIGNCELYMNNILFYGIIPKVNLNNRELSEIISLANVIQKLSNNGYDAEVENFIKKWPDIDFTSIVMIYFIELNKHIDLLLNKKSINKKIKAIFFLWKSFLTKEKCLSINDIINKQMLKWKNIHPEFPIVTIPSDVIKNIGNYIDNNISQGLK